MAWNWFTSAGRLKTVSYKIYVGNILIRNLVSVSANYNIGSNDSIIEVTDGSGSVTITLPTAVGITGRIFTILAHSTASISPISIATTSSQLINGALGGMSLNQNYASVDLVSNGTNWRIL